MSGRIRAGRRAIVVPVTVMRRVGVMRDAFPIGPCPSRREALRTTLWVVPLVLVLAGVPARRLEAHAGAPVGPGGGWRSVAAGDLVEAYADARSPRIAASAASPSMQRT